MNTRALMVTELIGELTQLELQGFGGLVVYARQGGIDRREPIYGITVDIPNNRATLTIYAHEAELL